MVDLFCVFTLFMNDSNDYYYEMSQTLFVLLKLFRNVCVCVVFCVVVVL